jgi:branched-chain amino acid transport system ATP-binding protein
MMLQLKNVNAGYGHANVLNDLTLDVEKGKIVTIVGPNGAGKTTTLRTICGLVKITKGEIYFDGQKISGMSSDKIVRCGLAHCPEGRQIWPKMTVLENLQLGAFSRKDKDEIQNDIEKMFNTFPILRERQNQLAESLSGGEQQALAVARSLMLRPKMILFDEPSLGLSPILVKETLNMIAELPKRQNVTVLLVEQNARAALKIADWGYVLEKGSVVLSGPAAELANNKYVQKAYLGM